MKNITIIDGELRLSSNLDEYSFGKTDYESIVTQEGFIFDSKTEDFSPWCFNDVRSYKVENRQDPVVFYCGINPLSSSVKTLLDYLDEESINGFKATELTCKALTKAAKEGKAIPLNGAGGILVDIDAQKVLFLPEGLYKYSANGYTPEERLQLQTGWINSTLYELPAICYTRAVLVYRLLTGRLPYTATDDTERNADILDRKFLPLELSVNGINLELAKQVNKALKLNSNVVNIPGKKQKGKGSEDLTPTPEFPLELLEGAWKLTQDKSSKISDKEFEEKAASYIKIRDSKIKTKRSIRRNSATIITVSIVAVVLISIITSSIKSRRDEYCSMGLTSTETIKSFFIGVNSKSTVFLSNLVDGKTPQNYVDSISQIYVLDKQRHIYDGDNGFASPENWLLFSTTMNKYQKSGIYGVSNLKIDGKDAELDVKPYKINQKQPPVTTEGNITLEDKAESVHKVEYYLIHSEGENNYFIVEKVFSVFTLTYKKDCWKITDISSDSTNIQVRCAQFKTDYFNQLAVTEGDVLKAVNNLRNQYPWLPTQTAIENEQSLQLYNKLNPFSQVFFYFETL